MDDDQPLLTTITHLVEEEQALRTAPPGGRDEPRRRAIEVELDRCWDLLRQRRTRRGPGAGGSRIAARDAAVVESYLQ